MTAADGPLIRCDALRRRLGQRGLVVVDCRFNLLDPEAGRAAWLAGHVPGAVYAHLDNDLAGPITADSGRHPLPDVASLSETFGRLGIGSRSDVVVYDDGSGGIAARAWWLLRWLGHERVQLLDGGFKSWLNAGFDTEAGAVTVPPASFDAAEQAGWVVTTQEVADALARGDLCLVDARDAERFRGDREPIDAVAGHVPGALNFPFADNLEADGTWRSPDGLRAVWQARLGDRTSGNWAVMCGSGVTACHLALAAELAGLRAPRLYAGSWSEWIRDPARPVAGGQGFAEPAST